MKKIIGLLMIALFMLAGCSSAKESKKVEIEFQHSMVEQERIDAIQVVIDEFNEKNSDIIVTQVPVNEDAYNEKIVTQGSAGQLPAVMQVGKDVLGTMSGYNYIDTDSNNTIMETLGADKFYEGVLELSKDELGENYLMLPNDAWVQGIWYNKDLFEKENLEAPTNYETILAAAKALQTDSTYGIVVPSDESTFTQQVFSQLALANEANIVNNKGEITFDTNEMKESMTQYSELSKYSQEGSVNIDQVKDTFLSGKTNMVFYSTYMFPALTEAGTVDSFGFTPLMDAQSNPVAFGNPSGLTVTNGLKEEEKSAAIKFTEYMMQSEQMVKWNLMTVGGGLPSRPDVLNSEEYQSNEVVKQMSDLMPLLEDSLKGMQSFGTVEGKNYNILGPVTDARTISMSINQILVHDADVSSTVKEAQTAMEALK
ncbi:MAG: ABC transporter substrate-binding protein [Lactovum sp.]